MITLDGNRKSIMSQLALLNQGIKSIDNVISYQKDEIIKTETLIKRLQICLVDQNNALKNFSDERKIMEEESDYILKLLKFSKDSIFNNDKCGDREQFDDNKLICENYNQEKSVETIKVKRKNLDIADCDNKEKRMKSHQCIDPDSIKVVSGCENYSSRNPCQYGDNTNETMQSGESPHFDLIIDESICTRSRWDSPRQSDNSTEDLDNFDRNSRIMGSPHESDVSISVSLLSEPPECINTEIPLQKQLLIPELKNRTINIISMKSETSDIFIGCSNGLLLKHYLGRTHVYQTNTSHDIIHIETVKLNRIIFLAAFTKDKILVYDYESHHPVHELAVKGIRYMFNDGNTIYIILHNGHVKRLNKQTWQITTDAANSYFKSYCYFPATQTGKYALVTVLNDPVLYKVNKSDFNERKVIPDLNGIKRIWRVKGKEFLCFSNKLCWLLNENLSIIDTKRFEHGIKYVDHDGHSVVVGDQKNTVHVYSLDYDNFGEKIFQKRLPGNITALATSNNKVYVAIGDQIFIY